MKTRRFISFTVIAVFICLQSFGANRELKLGGPKDLVLNLDVRQLALEVASDHLSEKDTDFLDAIKTAQTPYEFEQPKDPIPDPASELAKANDRVVRYSDASILEVVSKKFASQVRGQIARGSQTFLQLTGGSLVGKGSRVPVSIPLVEGKTFTLTIQTITSDSYTLQLGEATQTISFSGDSSAGSPRIRFD